MKKKIFIICTVRGASQEYLKRLYEYAESLEADGHIVHLPPRDTKQEDETGGYIICKTNVNAIRTSDEVHVFEYNEKSTGTHFDLGATFAMNKKIVNINPPEINEELPKSFPKMMKYWESVCDTCLSGYSYVGHNLKKCPKCGEDYDEENIG